MLGLLDSFSTQSLTNNRTFTLKIRIEHKYIGAALMQIAEHPQFTAINSMKIKDKHVNNAFKINNNIGIFCKYASKPNEKNKYLFTFNSEQMENIKLIHNTNEKLCLALICIEDEEICCLSYEQFEMLLESRRKSAKGDEEQYQIIVTAKQGASLRVCVNAAGKKGATAGKPIVISRKSFPESVFT